MPRNTKRTFLAKEYAAATRWRLNAQEFTIGPGAATEITNICPTQAALGDAPCFDLLVGFNPNVVNSGLFGVAVTDDPTRIDINYPYTGEEETEGIRVRGLFPYDAGEGGLVTPLTDPATGNPVINRVYLVNRQAAGNVTVQVVIERPILDWE